jgi:cell division protein FtsW
MGKRSIVVLVVSVCLLVALGVTMLASTGYYSGDGGEDGYFNVRRQITFLAVGLVGCAFFVLLDYNVLYRWRWGVFAASAILLSLVWMPGLGLRVNGATRWLDFRFFNMQPSEFAKIGLIITLAGWFATHELLAKKLWRGFFAPLCMSALIIGLIGCEVDLGNALLAAMVAISIMFVAGSRIIYILPIMTLAGGALWLAIQKVPNRFERILAFLDLEAYKDSWGLQQWISLIAFGSGGVEGRGLGEGVMKMSYLPEAHTDFIFPMIGEEMGFRGAAATVFLFLLIAIAGMTIASHAPNRFGKLLGFGLTLLLSLEAILNMSVTTALAPNKGLPLPFVSYGGSSLMAAMICIGILINIHRQGVHLKPEDLAVIKRKKRWTPQV